MSIDKAALETRYTAKFALVKGNKVLSYMKIAGAAFPEVTLAGDGAVAPTILYKYILAVYVAQAKAAPALMSDADDAAALLEPGSLCAALEETVAQFPLLFYPALLYPYCRYASGAMITLLLREKRNWIRAGAKGKTASAEADKALLLSDTREAMLYMDKSGALSRYAEMRATDAETLRDTVLSGFDLDDNGEKVYDLGNTIVIARLNPDLTVGLYDSTTGKEVRTLPKRGEDPDKYEVAAADLKDIRANVKKIAKARNNFLFAAFLDSTAFPATSWKAAYLINPLLRQIASLLVWEQDGRTFTLAGKQSVDADGNTVALTEASIYLAHPMELPETVTEAWQRYFTSRGLKQYFAQVWEPVRRENEIAPNRYEGVNIPVKFTMNASRHGIHFEPGNRRYGEGAGFSCDDCMIENAEIEDGVFTLGEISFDYYTRMVNHIVAVLDRWTVRDRIAKDDASIAELLPGFTLAQITELLTLATERGATNCTALLLEYKNTHYADFDPMAEFTLE